MLHLNCTFKCPKESSKEKGTPAESTAEAIRTLSLAVAARSRCDTSCIAARVAAVIRDSRVVFNNRRHDIDKLREFAEYLWQVDRKRPTARKRIS